MPPYLYLDSTRTPYTLSPHIALIPGWQIAPLSTTHPLPGITPIHTPRNIDPTLHLQAYSGIVQLRQNHKYISDPKVAYIQ